MSLTLADSVQQIKNDRNAVPEAIGKLLTQAQTTTSSVVRLTNLLRKLAQQINQAQSEMADLDARTRQEIAALQQFLDPYVSAVKAHADEFASAVGDRWERMSEQEKEHHEATSEILELFHHTQDHVHDADGELQSAIQGGLLMIGGEVERMEAVGGRLEKATDELDGLVARDRARAMVPLDRLGDTVPNFRDRGETALTTYVERTQHTIDELPGSLHQMFTDHLQKPVASLVDETRNRLDAQVNKRGEADCGTLVQDGLAALLGGLRQAQHDNEGLVSRLAGLPENVDHARDDLGRCLDHLEHLLNLLGLLSLRRMQDVDETFFKNLESKTGVSLDYSKLVGDAGLRPALRAGLLQLELAKDDAQKAREAATALERQLGAVTAE